MLDMDDDIYQLRCSDCQQIVGYSVGKITGRLFCVKHSEIRNLTSRYIV